MRTVNEMVPILGYHFFSNGRHSYALAEDELPYVLEEAVLGEHLQGLVALGYQSVSLAEYIGGVALPPKPVVLTVDDGHVSFYHIALPLLVEHGFRATVFVPGRNVGRDGYLTASQLCDLTTHGIEIGAHGQSHRPLTAMTAVDAREELRASKEALEEAMGTEVAFMALPHGFGSPMIIEAARELGYRAVCTSRFGVNGRAARGFCLNRIGIKDAISWSALQPLMAPGTVEYWRAVALDRTKSLAKWVLRMHKRG